MLSHPAARKGVVRASLTKLRTQLDELQATINLPDTIDHVKRLSLRLQTLAEDFKLHHYAIVELVDNEEDSRREQEVLDEHDEEVSRLAICLEKLSTSCSSSGPDQLKVPLKRLKHLEKALYGGATSFPVDGDICLLQQYEEQLSELKKEFSDTRHSLLSLDIEDSREVGELLSRIEKSLFDCTLKIRKQLHDRAPTTSALSVPNAKGIKLPQLDFPTFDGNILSLNTFWEQFTVAVHGRTTLTDAEKLAYLRHALKGSSARSVIEGLSRSGEHYDEAITCLKSRYNRPRLIHQAHVRKILETPNLKDGSGKELRRLNDTAQQHLRELKAMGREPSGAFMTSLLELKLDINTIFEWQIHSQDSTDVPHYKRLLEFIDLGAQASEAAVSDSGKKPFKMDNTPPAKKNPPHP